MGKKDKFQKNNNKDKKKDSILTSWTKRWIRAILMFLAAIIVLLSFLDKAGGAGQLFMKASTFLAGNAIFALPLFLMLGGFIFLKTRKKGKNLALFLAILVAIVGIAGVFGAHDLTLMKGGWIGFLLGKLLVGSFGLLAANVIFGAVIVIGMFIFLQFIWQEVFQEKPAAEKPEDMLKSSDAPNFRIK